MTIQKFEPTPTPSEALDLHSISEEKSKQAWQQYQAKPEYKDFNKHDMIESMQKNTDSNEE